MAPEKHPLSPLSLRLSPELEERLENVAARLGVKKTKLAQDAIEAAVAAIERNEFRLVLPLEFEVTHVATPREGKTQVEINRPGEVSSKILKPQTKPGSFEN